MIDYSPPPIVAEVPKKHSTGVGPEISPAQAQRQSQRSADEANRIAEEANDIARDQAPWTFIQAMISVLSVAFAGWAAFAATQAARASERATELMRSQIRPHLSTKHARVENFAAGEIVRGHILLNNTGGGPALAVQSFTALIIRAPGTAVDLPPKPAGEFGTINIGQGNEYELNPELNGPLTSDQHQKISAGQLAIYLLAWVTYEDGLGTLNEDRIVLESTWRDGGLVFKPGLATKG